MTSRTQVHTWFSEHAVELIAVSILALWCAIIALW